MMPNNKQFLESQSNYPWDGEGQRGGEGGPLFVGDPIDPIWYLIARHTEWVGCAYVIRDK